MSGVRWTTGVGIAVGGVGGAVAALLGAPSSPASSPPKAPASSVPAPSVAAPVASVAEPAPRVAAAAAPGPEPSAPASAAPSAEPEPKSSFTPPPLELPTTVPALLKAQVLCDQKKLYDECSRAAEALEQGTAGAADLVQAKRFRKIALTYLVAECEAGDPHACFVMAAKYRTGTELKASPVRAEALEKRGVELCRLRKAPECPAS